MNRLAKIFRRQKTLYQSALDMVFGLVLVIALMAGDQATKTEAAEEQAKRSQQAADDAKDEAEQAKQDAEDAKDEAEQAKQDAEDAREEADQAKQDAEDAKDEAEQAKQDAKDAQDEADDAKSNASGFEGKFSDLVRALENPVRLRIAVDQTGSMKEEIGLLSSAVTTITSVLGEFGKPVEVQIAAYRDGKLVEFPLTTIEHPSSDKGRSFEALEAWLADLEAVGGYANLTPAIDKVLEADDGFPGVDVFMLLGDADCGEEANKTKSVEATLERQVLKQIRAWSKAPGTDRRVVSFFAGDADNESRPFFQSVSDKAAQGVYADDAMQMLRVLLKEVLPEVKK